MFTPFNTQSLYVGTNLKKFNEIRDILDANKIKYKYKAKNQLGEWSGRGGTVRGNMGSMGNKQELMYEYNVIVMKSDYENANDLIRQHHK